jgi:hypothetical protein
MNKKLEFIRAKDKWGDHDVRSDDFTIAGAALKLLAIRAEEGFWYDDEDQGFADAIVKASDGQEAWRFLYERRDYEYEWVEARSL